MMVPWTTANFQDASKCMAIFIYFVVENQISQVVQNLIVNAKQAMPDGGVIEATCTNINRKEHHLPQILKGDKYVQVTQRREKGLYFLSISQPLKTQA